MQKKGCAENLCGGKTYAVVVRYAVFTHQQFFPLGYFIIPHPISHKYYSILHCMLPSIHNNPHISTPVHIHSIHGRKHSVHSAPAGGLEGETEGGRDGQGEGVRRGVRRAPP